jgi:hypothetical protein
MLALQSNRMKLGSKFICLLATVGCAAQQQTSNAPKLARADYILRASEWSAIVQLATEQAEFVGVDQTENTLFIGYIRTPEANLALLTNRSDVKAFSAPRSRADISAALVAAREMITALQVPFVGLSSEYRSGSIIVTDVENATKRGPYFCDQLVKIPNSIGTKSVALIDRRSCAAR